MLDLLHHAAATTSGEDHHAMVRAWARRLLERARTSGRRRQHSSSRWPTR